MIKVKKGNLCIRCFRIIIHDKTSAKTPYSQRHTGIVHDKAGIIDLMGTQIAHVSVSGVPEPVPVIMQVFAHQRFQGRRAGPEIIIDIFRDFLRAFHFANSFPEFIPDTMNPLNISEMTFADILYRIPKAGIRAILCAGLYNSAVFLCRFHNFTPFPDIVRDGFLHIYILSGLAGPDGHQGMPVIGRSDNDGIDIFIIQQMADIGIRVEGKLVFFFELFLSFCQNMLIDIT